VSDLWIIDAFCGAGGCTRGYQRTGFKVLGVDMKEQPNYCGDEFVKCDALHFLRHIPAGVYVAIHASPPCQAYTTLRTLQGDREYPDLVGPTRGLLQATGLPYVIENVVGAPLENPVMLCGTMFTGLRVTRHRLFECSFRGVVVPEHKPHPLHYTRDKRKPHYGRLDEMGAFVTVTGGGNCSKAAAADAMGIDWMTKDELNQAIPPAYTEHIGWYLMDELDRRARVAA
jgi:DNA (cytosine-5)-methyltransferase 1